MQNLTRRTASLCVVLLLLGKTPAFAQDAAPTPQEEERAREVLRAGLDDTPGTPGPFDPHSAKTWEVAPQADIAPGLHANLFQPSTETLSATADGDWLPGTNIPKEDRAATTSAPAPPETAEPPANLARPPARAQKSGKSRTTEKKSHSKLRSGRAALDTKPAPPKKVRPKVRRTVPKTPAPSLPGELQP